MHHMNMSELLRHERLPHSEEASDELAPDDGRMGTSATSPRPSAFVYICNILKRELSALASKSHG